MNQATGGSRRSSAGASARRPRRRQIEVRVDSARRQGARTHAPTEASRRRRGTRPARRVRHPRRRRSPRRRCRSAGARRRRRDREVLRGGDTLDERAVDLDTQVVRLPANLDDRAETSERPSKTSGSIEAGLSGSGSRLSMCARHSLRSSSSADPLFEQAVETLAHLEQLVLDAAPDARLQRGTMVFVLEMVIPMHEGLELLTQRHFLELGPRTPADHGGASTAALGNREAPRESALTRKCVWQFLLSSRKCRCSEELRDPSSSVSPSPERHHRPRLVSSVRRASRTSCSSARAFRPLLEEWVAEDELRSEMARAHRQPASRAGEPGFR